MLQSNPSFLTRRDILRHTAYRRPSSRELSRRTPTMGQNAERSCSNNSAYILNRWSTRNNHPSRCRTAAEMEKRDSSHIAGCRLRSRTIDHFLPVRCMIMLLVDHQWCRIIVKRRQVPAHAELMWILSCTASVGYLSRMTQWKVRCQKTGRTPVDRERYIDSG